VRSYVHSSKQIGMLASAEPIVLLYYNDM